MKQDALNHRLLKLARNATAALPYAAGSGAFGARQLGGTEAELNLESEWTQALEPTIEELYRYPLRNGLAAVPDGGEDEIREWALGELDSEDATAVLLFVMTNYAAFAFDVGGQQALVDMGIDDTFSLGDDDIIEDMEGMVESDLVAVDGSLSLTRTTAVDLARQINIGREDDLGLGELSAALAAYITGRSVSRSGMVALDNTVRFSRLGTSHTFHKNGLEQVIHRTSPELTETGPCPICQPRDGNVYKITSGIVVGDDIPLHGGCVCYHEGAVDGDPLAETDWTPPEGVWTGG